MYDSGCKNIYLRFYEGHNIPLWERHRKYEIVEKVYPDSFDGVFESAVDRASKDVKDMNSFVYFISDGRYIKIGKANDVMVRRDSLQTAHATKLEVAAVIPCDDEWIAKELEKDLHRCFQQYSMLGEWFDIINNDKFQIIKNQFKAEVLEEYNNYLKELLANEE